MKKGIDLIAEERQKQINNGYDSNHDSQHDFSELVSAAKTYIDAAILTVKSEEIGNSDEASISWHKDNEPFEWKDLKLEWPWEEETFKPTTSLKDLIKAGALIAAAIDRLQKDNDQQQVNSEVYLEKEFDKCCENYTFDDEWDVYTARHFFKLGFQKAQKGE